jgi:transposase
MTTLRGRVNRVLHIMATVQLRNPTAGRAYFDRKKAAGKTSVEAMRCLKRRLSDIVYRHLVDDAISHATTGPGGQQGNDPDSSGRLTSRCQLFGQTTSRTGHHQAYDPSPDGFLTRRGASCVRTAARPGV